MALFNYANREITAKVVYYGPGMCGKTTSLQYIHERIAPAQRGRLLSLATETDRTIFFDLLPLKLGEIGGFKLRFQLYTVPGQVKYNKTRKLVLQGADAVVFVADSQRKRREANVTSYKNLQENLREQKRRLEDIPLVYEFNKRDMDDLLSAAELNQDVNPHALPFFEAVATRGIGVMETLEAISKLALEDMEKRLTAGTSNTPQEDVSDEDLLEMMEDDEELLDLTGGDDDSLSFSSDELDSLELESDLSESKPLESKPIGYDGEFAVEEIEIQDENIAHTGSLQESEFFNLKEIEDQALRELDEFLEGSDSTAGGSPDELSFAQEANEEFLDFSLENDSSVSQAETPFDPGDGLSASDEAEDGLEFSLEDDDAGDLQLDAEPELSFSSDAEGEDTEPLSFELEPSAVETAEPLQQGGFGGLSLEETEEEAVIEPGLAGESSAKGTIELLDIAEGDLDISFGDGEEDGSDDFPAFNLDETDDPEKSADFPEDDELTPFRLDDDSLESVDEALGSLNLGDDEKLSVSEGLDAEQHESPMDFRITDSVRFEMQVGEDISSVTPFEQQLEELSEDGFTGEAEQTDGGEFQPEVAEIAEEEQFQTISDEWTRLIVLSKYFYHRGEAYRAQHAVGDNTLAVLLYYTSVETALKAVASKYETCNPTIASFHLMLESIEEETEKEVAGAKSLLNNIVVLKDRIQLEAAYPDDDECELAARICERFLGSLAEEFLTIDFSTLSPVLARGEEK